MTSAEILIIDGSYGEGGGQIVRNALALSLLTKKPIRIFNIRAGRKNPGLRPQHLAAVKGAARISGGVVTGAEKGSEGLVFFPKEIAAGEYRIDVGSAGSITLLLQSLLPPLISQKESSTLYLTGGTDVPHSPPVDWIRHVLFPVLGQMGVRAELNIIRRGFYPEGGGEVEVRIPGVQHLKPLRMERGAEGKIFIRGRAFASNLPHHIPERMANAAEETLRRALGKEVMCEIETADEAGRGRGAGITLWAEGKGRKFFRPGASALGKKGVPSEKVGRKAAESLILELKGGFPIDIHASDQLPVFAPLIRAPPAQRLHYPVRETTSHLMTVLWLLGQFGLHSEMRQEKMQVREAVVVI